MALVLPNSVFVHVPKTGGSWVRAAIRAAGIHAEESGPFDVHDHYGVFDLPAFLTSRFTFGFVRHPVDWLKSRWAWGILSGFKAKLAHEPAAAGHWMASCWSDDFPTFVRGYLASHRGVATTTMLRSLGWRKWVHRWEKTRYAVDFVGLYENLQAGLFNALDRAGERYAKTTLVHTPPHRVGAQGELSDRCRLSRGLRRQILLAESSVCKLFGYR